jgi:hypothetical protein
MDSLQTLGWALGLATLAGVNLYLTVLAAGLAFHFGWVILPAQLHDLLVLGDPWIISISGVLYFLGFFADKIPWVDSANDAIHTFIRPLGGALLAVLALGDAHPTVKVIAALLAGGVTLTSHAAKSGTRLVANTSPEPVSNVGLSLGEDAIVLGGLGLIAWHPVVAMIVALIVLVVIWVTLPRLLRSMKTILWLAWRKLNGPPAGEEETGLSLRLPAKNELALRRAHASTEKIAFAVPCFSGGGPRLPKNRRGWLVRFDGGRLFFVSNRWQGPLVVEIPAQNVRPERASRFLYERLALEPEKGASHVFLFERGHRLVADHVARNLSTAPSPLDDPEPAVAAA